MDNEITDQVPEGEDLDDVEAHGLKEVAVGLGAAAVIGSGASAAMAMAGGPHQPVPPAPSTTISHQVSGAQQGLNQTWAGRDAGQLAADTGGTAGDAAHFAGGVAGGVAHVAVTEADAAVGIAGGAVSDATRLAVNLTGPIASDAVHTAGDAVHTAGDTATFAERAAGGVANVATHVVQHLVPVVLNVTTQTLHTVTGTVNNVLQIQVGASAGAHGLSPSGTVTVYDAAGHILGSATVNNGSCSITIASSAGTISLHYSGDRTFASATVAHAL